MAQDSLDVHAEAAGASLDPLVQLAAYAFRAPVAFVSMVEARRQRLIARVGLDITETSLQDAICARSIGSPDVLVVPDLREDPRFSSHPLVLHPPHLRFYAGAPLLAPNGVAIGALCVMDGVPRSFTAEDERQLLVLARAAVDQLALRTLAGRLDPVSGLPNRHQFAIDYAAAVGRGRHGMHHAALVDVLDVARAGEAGQVLGMPPLEALIRRAGARLKAALEGVATVYHVGVARFVFVLDHPSAEAVECQMQSLQERLLRPLMAAAVPMVPGFHAGLCPVDTSCDTAEDVVRKALIGLHAALAARTPWHWYSSARDEALRRGYRLAVDGERGLRREEFHLVYQPRFRASDLSLSSAEVLIRWVHPRLGPVSPAEFIPVFERTALMEGVTDWVVEQALGRLAQWRRQGLDISLSINLSARDMGSPGAALRVLDRIAEQGLDSHLVEIEITEGEWLRAASIAGEQVMTLAAAGVRIAVDDFGSGYSNFGYLTELPVDTLKLDKSLIDRITVDERALLKARTIITLAKGLGHATVAEGAETMEQVEVLRTLGCDEIQGYALARPLSAGELEQQLRRSQAPVDG